jgi:hypothetical protein
MSYKIEILKKDLTKVAEVLNPLPLDGRGTILTFSKELSDFGQCKFRVLAFDQILTQYGDILQPHQYHVRVRRNGKVVWQGAIIDNTKRTTQFIEVLAAEYEFYLSKVLVKRSSTDPATGTANGIYRIFSSGTLSTAVTNIIDETIALLDTTNNSSSILSGMTLGTVENPNYAPNMTDSTGASLTGAWNFTTNFQLTYDFQTVLYVLKSLGIYSYADFYIDNSLVFNFEKFVGNNRHYDVNFIFNKSGEVAQSNIIDYNLPRLGGSMVNDLYGIATDTNGVVLHKDHTDQTSITANGLMQGVAAYSDIKDSGILDARVQAELPLVATPDETNAMVVLNETTAYPLGIWDIGDIVTINVQNTGVSFDEIRRIVGVSVQVNDTGRETTVVQTNRPLAWQYGSKTS